MAEMSSAISPFSQTDATINLVGIGVITVRSLYALTKARRVGLRVLVLGKSDVLD
jgi:hypothetical protein